MPKNRPQESISSGISFEDRMEQARQQLGLENSGESINNRPVLLEAEKLQDEEPKGVTESRNVKGNLRLHELVEEEAIIEPNKEAFSLEPTPDQVRRFNAWLESYPIVNQDKRLIAKLREDWQTNPPLPNEQVIKWISDRLNESQNDADRKTLSRASKITDPELVNSRVDALNEQDFLTSTARRFAARLRRKNPAPVAEHNSTEELPIPNIEAEIPVPQELPTNVANLENWRTQSEVVNESANTTLEDFNKPEEIALPKAVGETINQGLSIENHQLNASATTFPQSKPKSKKLTGPDPDEIAEIQSYYGSKSPGASAYDLYEQKLPIRKPEDISQSKESPISQPQPSYTEEMFSELKKVGETMHAPTPESLEKELEKTSGPIYKNSLTAESSPRTQTLNREISGAEQQATIKPESEVAREIPQTPVIQSEASKSKEQFNQDYEPDVEVELDTEDEPKPGREYLSKDFVLQEADFISDRTKSRLDFSEAQSMTDLRRMLTDEGYIVNGVGEKTDSDTMLAFIYDRLLNREDVSREWTQITRRHRLREMVYVLRPQYEQTQEYRDFKGFDIRSIRSIEDLTKALWAKKEGVHDRVGNLVTGAKMASYIGTLQESLLPDPILYTLRSLRYGYVVSGDGQREKRASGITELTKPAAVAAASAEPVRGNGILNTVNRFVGWIKKKW